MSLAVYGKAFADVVKNLKDALVIIEKGDKKSEKAVEEVNKWLQMVKGIIYGQDGQEPNSEQVAQLAQETYNANVLPMLIRNLAKLDFESKKDVAQIFNNLLRRQIGTRSPTVEYLGARPEILIVLVHGYENGDIAVTCGSMLRECIRHDQLAKILLNHESFYKFFEYVEMSSFDIASDAYSTFKDLITKHKTLCAEFLDGNYDKFFSEYQKLLNSENYVTRRQSLKLLGELLLDRHNFNVMTKYISNPGNLKLMMELLREKGRSIQFEAFHVFKVFLANPDLPAPLADILLRNPEELADYLQTFFQVNAGDLWPLEELELCVDLLRLLPDNYSDTLEVCEKEVMDAVSKILKSPPHRIDQRYKLAALGLVDAFTAKRGPLWFEHDCQLLCLVAHLSSAELRIILDNPGEIAFNSLIICIDLLEMSIKAVDDEDFINDEDSLRISRAVQDASAFIVSHWVGAQDIDSEKEKITQEVAELFYRYLCTLFSYGGEIFLQPDEIKKVTPLLVRVFHQFCTEKDAVMASALIKVLNAIKYGEKIALLLCDFLSITDPTEPDSTVINETILSIVNLSVRCDWHDSETLSILKSRTSEFTTEKKLHEMIVLTDVAEPSEGVRLVQQQVQCYVDDSCIGDGSLCVSERSVTWISRETKKGFSLTYPSIILHAVSTDISTFAYECIYVLVDCSRAERRRPRNIPLYSAAEAANVNDLNLAQEELEDQGEDDDSETSPNVQIRFVPTDTSILNEIYRQMCECQELNPDEDDVSDEEEEMEGLAEENVLGFAPPNGGSWITAETLANSDGDVELSEEGLATLQRILGGGGATQNRDTNEDEDMME